MVKHLTLFAAIGVIAASPVSAQSYRCENSGNIVVGLHAYIVSLVTAMPSDTALIADRIEHYLPTGSSDIVQFESDPTVCAAAGGAYHGVMSVENPPAQRHHLIVIKVGANRYIVFDPEEETEESKFKTYIIFDSSWNKLAAFAT